MTFVSEEESNRMKLIAYVLYGCGTILAATAFYSDYMRKVSEKGKAPHEKKEETQDVDVPTDVEKVEENK